MLGFMHPRACGSFIFNRFYPIANDDDVAAHGLNANEDDAAADDDENAFGDAYVGDDNDDDGDDSYNSRRSKAETWDAY